MLNLKEIVERIEQPNLCRVEDIEDLKLFSTNYPYTQIFPILYLKALANNNDIRFEEELTKFAFRISDREQLYNLIHPANKTEKVEEGKIEQEIISTPKLEEVKISVLSVVPEVEEISVDPGLEEISLKGESVFTSKDQDEKIEKIIPDEKVDTLQEIESLDDEEDLEDVFIPLNITTLGTDSKEEIEKEDEDLSDEISIEEKSDNAIIKFDKEILSEAITANYNLDHHTHPIQTISEVIENSEELKEIFEEIIEGEIKIDETIIDHSKKSFSSWLRSNENDTSLKIDEEKSRIDALVNKFLIDEPKISRPVKEAFEEEKPKKEFFSPVKKAKASLDVKSMPVSETLAKIFAVQGNYPKAIFAYEQLILINPEKKIFFASQIEDLKKKLNT